jgi:hypothetical protein
MGLPTSYSWILTNGGAGSGAAGGMPVPGGNRVTANGKQGLAIPVCADGRGRFSLVSGDLQLQKLIILNLSDCESYNPFQDGEIGIGSGMVFAVASDKLRADVRSKIALLFRRLQLQDRARLLGRPKFTTDPSNQEVTVDFEYLNLEENKKGDMSLKFSLQGSTAPR